MRSFSTTSLNMEDQVVKGSYEDRLMKLGYRVDLVPVNGVNQCQIVMCGYEVFRCNINNLMFNSPYIVDVVCQRAVHAVEEATKMLSRARSYLYFWALLEQQIFKGSEYDVKEFYAAHIERVRELPASLEECTKCCNILSKKNT